MILLLTKYGGFYYGTKLTHESVGAKPVLMLWDAFFIKRGKRMISYSRIELPRGTVVAHKEVSVSEFLFDQTDLVGTYNRAVSFAEANGMLVNIVHGLRRIEVPGPDIVPVEKNVGAGVLE